jgi:hypothetical protein
MINDKINDFKYDAFYIENKKGQNFELPQNCQGAIGITLDDNLKGYKHRLINKCNKFSSNLQKIEPIDSHKIINLTNIMHGFVVTGQMELTSLSICEATSKGVNEARIEIGDDDWTSMILFIPRDPDVAKNIALNALLELTKDDILGRTANYGFFAGLISVVSKKNFDSREPFLDPKTIAYEMTDFIKSRGVKDYNGNPKACICSQLALRILRNSTLISAIPKEKLLKYELLDDYKLRKKLVNKILKIDSPLNKAYLSSALFDLQANVDTLPYELYLSLKKESELHF